MGVRLKAINRAKRWYPVTALLRYSSGRPHGAIDIAMPIGTPIYAPKRGKVIARSDGVRNNRRGERIYSGKPSNWILLQVRIRTRYGRKQRATIFFQHMSPGLNVRVGQKVKKGHLLGKSGNTGNSTGPHLHAGAQWVRRGRKASSRDRYDHINSAAMRVWPPYRFLGRK